MYQLYFLKILTDLSEPHGCVLEYLCSLDLLVQDLSKNHLKGHSYSCALQVFLKHLCLLFLLRLRIVDLRHFRHRVLLSQQKCTSGGLSITGSGFLAAGSSFFGYYFLGDRSAFLGSSFFGDSLGASPFLGSSFFGSSFLGYYFLASFLSSFLASFLGYYFFGSSLVCHYHQLTSFLSPFFGSSFFGSYFLGSSFLTCMICTHYIFLFVLLGIWNFGLFFRSLLFCVCCWFCLCWLRVGCLCCLLVCHDLSYIIFTNPHHLNYCTSTLSYGRFLFLLVRR